MPPVIVRRSRCGNRTAAGSGDPATNFGIRSSIDVVRMTLGVAPDPAAFIPPSSHWAPSADPAKPAPAAA